MPFFDLDFLQEKEGDTQSEGSWVERGSQVTKLFRQTPNGRRISGFLTVELLSKKTFFHQMKKRTKKI